MGLGVVVTVGRVATVQLPEGLYASTAARPDELSLYWSASAEAFADALLLLAERIRAIAPDARASGAADG